MNKQDYIDKHGSDDGYQIPEEWRDSVSGALYYLAIFTLWYLDTDKKNQQYFIYPLKETPLFYLLDKNFLINEIRKSKAKIIDDKYYTFSINKKNQKINIFFKKEDLSLIGWQTEDIYQNLSVTFIYNIKLNKNIDENVFKLPKTFWY